jgi:signal transduction histidine kinase
MLPRGLPYRVPLLAGLVAVVVAAVLVVYLQRQYEQQQQQRTAVIVQQICDRSAGALAGKLRELLGGAVLYAVEGIGHRELKLYNLARVDRFFRAGSTQHPYVTRFFLWHERMPRRFERELLFYRPPGEEGRNDIEIAPRGEEPHGGFFSDPLRGAQLWQVGARAAALGKGFAVEMVSVDGVPHQVVYHFMWDDGERKKLFGILGFMVNVDDVRHVGFERIVASGLEPLLNPSPAFVKLALHVEDEGGRTMYGRPRSIANPSGAETFEILFFPRTELENYVARMPAMPHWRLTVSPMAPLPESNGSGPWLLAIVVLLLLIAVVCSVIVTRQAIRLSELQSDFVANVSHQLRTPLAMLSGAAETLGLGRVRSPEKVKEYADIVQAQTQRLSVLVDQILHFHRAEFAALHPVRQPVDLGELIVRAASEFQAPLARAGAATITQVTMRVECPEPGLVVRGDPVALEFAVVNLLENAVKYGGTLNEVTVSVSSRRGYGVITVRDCGVGISRSDLPHIFDKFYRGHAESQPRRGFGLGLAIVRSTVMVHGGRIAVESEPGRGSTFTVLLPLSA